MPVRRKVRDGPFDKAGFEVNDIILQVEGNPVGSADGLLAILNALKPQHKASVTAIDHNSGQSGTVQVILP